MAILKTKNADLNIHYKKYFQISMIIVLVLIIAAFQFSPNISIPDPIKHDKYDWMDVEKIYNTTQIIRPPRPPRPPRPQIPEIATTEELEPIEFDATDIDLTANLGSPPKIEKPFNRIVEEEDHIPFFAVEVKPELIGGLESIIKNVRYTEIAKRAQIEGRVSIEFIVSKTGNVEEAKVLKGISEELDMIALNAVKQAKFTPGLQRGKPVKVKMVIPIVFKLK